MTLVARSTDGLRDLADSLADTGAQIDTAAADASDSEGLAARMAELYSDQGAPSLIIYNAVMGAPDTLLDSTAVHLQTAYAVDVIGAIVVTQVAAPAMRAAGSGTIIVTGGGFADHPIPALATVSLGKAALRSAATMLGVDLEPDGIRVATLTIMGRSLRAPRSILRTSQNAIGRSCSPTVHGKQSSASPANRATSMLDGAP